MVMLVTLCGVPRVTPLFREGDRHRPAVVKQKKSEKRKKRQDEENKLLLSLKKGNFLFPVDLVLCLLHEALQEREGRIHTHTVCLYVHRKNIMA